MLGSDASSAELGTLVQESRLFGVDAASIAWDWAPECIYRSGVSLICNPSRGCGMGQYFQAGL